MFEEAVFPLQVKLVLVTTESPIDALAVTMQPWLFTPPILTMFWHLLSVYAEEVTYPPGREGWLVEQEITAQAPREHTQAEIEHPWFAPTVTNVAAKAVGLLLHVAAEL